MTETEIPMQAHSLGPSMSLACRAALEAGKLIRAGYGQLNEIEAKGVGDLVSQIDRDADQLIIQILRSESSLPILSEELHSDVGCEDDMWIVDPLDASSAFLMRAGRDYPAVLIALRSEAKTNLGVCHFPLTGEWFYAQRGRGAWRNGKRLICGETPRLGRAWVEMNQYGDSSKETAYFAELKKRLRSAVGAQLVTTNVPNSGVALRIAESDCGLAAAIHDNQPGDVKQGPWDIAAPQIVLEEAGGVFLSPTGQPTDPFSAEPIIVARSAELGHSIIDLSDVLSTSR